MQAISNKQLSTSALLSRLSKMVGQTYLYNTNSVKILSYKQKEDHVTIVTDKDWIEVPLFKLPALLEEFLEVEQEDEEPQHLPSPSRNSSLQVTQNARQNLSSLKDVLLDNITKVQKDKEYINQAKAINNNINTLMNMYKLELELTREIRKQI